MKSTHLNIKVIIITILYILQTVNSDEDRRQIISFISKNELFKIFNCTFVFEEFLKSEDDIKKMEFITKIDTPQENYEIIINPVSILYKTSYFNTKITSNSIIYGLRDDLKEDKLGLNMVFTLKIRSGLGEEKSCLLKNENLFSISTRTFLGEYRISDNKQLKMKIDFTDTVQKIRDTDVNCEPPSKRTIISDIAYQGMMNILDASRSESGEYLQVLRNFFENTLLAKYERKEIFSLMKINFSNEINGTLLLKYNQSELYENNKDYMLIYHLGGFIKSNYKSNRNNTFVFNDFDFKRSEQQSFLSINFINELLSFKKGTDYKVHSKFKGENEDIFDLNMNIEKIGSFIPDAYNLYMMHHKVILTTQYSIRECNIVKSSRVDEEYELSVRNKFKIEVFLANTEDVIIVINFNIRHNLLIVNVDKNNNKVNSESTYFNLLLINTEFEYINIEKYDYEVNIRKVKALFEPLVERYFIEKPQFLYLTPIGITTSIDFSLQKNFPIVVKEGIVINSILEMRKEKSS